jgi:hypothetical protein
MKSFRWVFMSLSRVVGNDGAHRGRYRAGEIWGDTHFITAKSAAIAFK